MILTTTQKAKLLFMEIERLDRIKKTVTWDSVPEIRKERLLKNIRVSALADFLADGTGN